MDGNRQIIYGFFCFLFLVHALFPFRDLSRFRFECPPRRFMLRTELNNLRDDETRRENKTKRHETG